MLSCNSRWQFTLRVWTAWVYSGCSRKSGVTSICKVCLLNESVLLSHEFLANAPSPSIISLHEFLYSWFTVDGFLGQSRWNRGRERGWREAFRFNWVDFVCQINCIHVLVPLTANDRQKLSPKSFACRSCWLFCIISLFFRRGLSTASRCYKRLCGIW